MTVKAGGIRKYQGQCTHCTVFTLERFFFSSLMWFRDVFDFAVVVAAAKVLVMNRIQFIFINDFHIKSKPTSIRNRIGNCNFSISVSFFSRFYYFGLALTLLVYLFSCCNNKLWVQDQMWLRQYRIDFNTNRYVKRAWNEAIQMKM